MCLNNNILYISHEPNPGGVAGVEMSNLSISVFLPNGTADCLESAHVGAYAHGIVFVATTSWQAQSLESESGKCHVTHQCHRKQNYANVFVK